jgi:hypothetical protein
MHQCQQTSKISAWCHWGLTILPFLRYKNLLVFNFLNIIS